MEVAKLTNKLELTKLFPVLLDLKTNDNKVASEIIGLHSGNLGDIIYSLPTAYALRINHYVINVCQDPNFEARVLTIDSALALAPLLLGQGTINQVTVINSQVPWEYADPKQIGVDHVLDSFRRLPNAEGIHLLYRHALINNAEISPNLPWIHLKGSAPKLSINISKPYVVVGLTGRYRRHGDDYYEQLLQDIPPENLVFIGTEGELYRKRVVPGQYVKARDHIELAWIIRQSALFIGNPSFPYALAEAMKVPRFVELPEGTNVAPLDPTGLPLDAYSMSELRSRMFSALQMDLPETTKMVRQLSQYQEWEDELVSLLLSSTSGPSTDGKHSAGFYGELISLLSQIRAENKGSEDLETSAPTTNISTHEFHTDLAASKQIKLTKFLRTEEIRKKLLTAITSILKDRSVSERQKDDLIRASQRLELTARESEDKLYRFTQTVADIFCIKDRKNLDPNSMIESLKEHKTKSDLFERVTRSISWRITAPLRAAKYRIKSCFRNS